MRTQILNSRSVTLRRKAAIALLVVCLFGSLQVEKAWAYPNQAAVSEAEIILLKAVELEKNGRQPEAAAAYAQVLALVRDGGSPFLKSEALWKLAEASERGGDIPGALRQGEEAVQTLPDSAVRRFQFGYMAIRLRQDRLAVVHLEYGVQNSKEVPVAVLRDLAYTLKRLGENKRARLYFKRSTDAGVQPESLPESQRQKVTELNYDLRREHETIERTWGMYTALTYWSPAKGDAVLQGSQEFYWQPYHKNGRKFIVFSRYYGNLWSQSPNAQGAPWIGGYDWGINQGGLGVSWKPLSDANLVLTVEKLFPVGKQGINDWMYRIGYSWDRGVEFEPFVKTWPYRTFYGEYVQWASSARQVLGMEARWGQSRRLGDRASRSVLTPHLFLIANYDSSYEGSGSQGRFAMAAGPGFVLRKWYREDKYSAPRSFWDLTVQYRFNLSGRRIDGLLIQWFNSF